MLSCYMHERHDSVVRSLRLPLGNVEGKHHAPVLVHQDVAVGEALPDEVLRSPAPAV